MRLKQMVAVTIFVFSGKVYAEKAMVVNCSFETSESGAVSTLKEWVNSETAAGVVVGDAIEGIFVSRQVLDKGTMEALIGPGRSQAVINEHRLIRIETTTSNNKRLCVILEGDVVFRKD